MHFHLVKVHCSFGEIYTPHIYGGVVVGVFVCEFSALTIYSQPVEGNREQSKQSRDLLLSRQKLVRVSFPEGPIPHGKGLKSKAIWLSTSMRMTQFLLGKKARGSSLF